MTDLKTVQQPEMQGEQNQLKGVRAMIFAAGLGTRLKPFTDAHPKALAPVNGKPLLQRNIEYLMHFGIRDIIVNVHHFADQIKDFLREKEDFSCRIQISHEIGEPLETGGGLLHAAWFLAATQEPFVVMNADILTNLDLGKMYAHHKQSAPIATLAVTNRKSSRNLLFDEEMRLCGWTNQNTGEMRMAFTPEKTPHPFAFSGIHVIDPEIFAMIRQTGKFSIIDSYLDLAATHQIQGYRHSRDIIVDVGRPESIIEAERFFQ